MTYNVYYRTHQGALRVIEVTDAQSIEQAREDVLMAFPKDISGAVMVVVK